MSICPLVTDALSWVPMSIGGGLVVLGAVTVWLTRRRSSQIAATMILLLSVFVSFAAILGQSTPASADGPQGCVPAPARSVPTAPPTTEPEPAADGLQDNEPDYTGLHGHAFVDRHPLAAQEFDPGLASTTLQHDTLQNDTLQNDPVGLDG
jgi:hypothetical protein